jgi:hypothetical protein
VDQSDHEALAAQALLERGRRAVRGDPPVVEDDDVVREAVRFLQVLSGEHERGAVAHLLAQQLPELVAAVRIEAGGWFVQEQHCRCRHQRGGEVEAPAHAAGKVLGQLLGDVGERDSLEQLAGTLAGGCARQVVEPPDQLEVGARAEQAVDGGGLRGHPDALAHPSCLHDHVVAGDPRAALGRRRQGGEDAQRRGLAGAVVPEQPEHAAGGCVQVDVAQRPQVAEALAQPLDAHAAAGLRSGGAFASMVYHCFVRHTTGDSTASWYTV